MALPDAIPVRYSEEEAGYVSFRPVRRQTFRLNELLDMVLSVTGKNPARIRLILHSGNVVFHFYRYWWDGFDATEEELSARLAQFPDPDPARPFAADHCALALLESAEVPPRAPLELSRAALSRKGLFQRRSFWDGLLAAAAAGPLTYDGYSYVHRADLYRLPFDAESRTRLDAAAQSHAPRKLRRNLRAIDKAAAVLFVCTR